MLGDFPGSNSTTDRTPRPWKHDFDCGANRFVRRTSSRHLALHGRCRRDTNGTTTRRETALASKRELALATAFFAGLAVLVLAFTRPLGPVGWTCLLTSLAFVALGCVALWKGDRPAAQHFGRSSVESHSMPKATILDPEPFEFDADLGEPPPEEQLVLETTLLALEEADALAPDGVDPSMLWQAAQHADPGQPLGYPEALHALAVLHELGRFTPRRLVFVPFQVEYDAELLAAITAETLSALGHDIAAGDVSVTFPPDGSQGEVAIAFPLKGRIETVVCSFLWKYPPPGLFEALMCFSRESPPRELVCADVGSGTLLLAALRPGSLDQLNGRFPVGYDMFGKP